MLEYVWHFNIKNKNKKSTLHIIITFLTAVLAFKVVLQKYLHSHYQGW